MGDAASARRERIDDAELERRVSRSEWTRDDDSIVRTFTFRTFRDAVRFVNAVADLAEDRDHHPDVDIRWNKVTLRLSTHSAGGLTPVDFELADAIDALMAPAD
jgi:4a-hydroxytetrahydrobiopterin dehydratase